ncbi:hypothetical protein [Alicyclobacillus acidoterrestris]|uniref:Uncharacterized protein n=1 Tax=Alicyclobacillus acidoterrestris (strain ATCC 49025 / DSM 3922 / CIP 106132 / NCIMB 13137 / GD3B) TaxID=1356854 RepID=A0A9E6ZEB9_ALIAG|nr:hypothetical protein [Alicyclobacillus acidoterrestris]UNO48012.1 hypothetical protein K1I37_15160 [Alicyclobacillus acidoterrestris]
MYNYCPHCGKPLPTQPTLPLYPPTAPVYPGDRWFGPTVTCDDWWTGVTDVHPNTPGNTGYREEDER